MDINGVVKYFKSVGDVSALYVFGGHTGFPESSVGLGVLADDKVIGMDELDGLEQECILRSSGPLSVVMLNTAPLYLKHYVASRGRVLFERSKGSHLRFARRALDEYSSVVSDGYDDDYELMGGVEYIGPFAEDEEYLS